jgi:hypothetical protein
MFGSGPMAGWSPMFRKRRRIFGESSLPGSGRPGRVETWLARDETVLRLQKPNGGRPRR